MPLLSAFTPLGMLRLSGAPSHAETIYNSMKASLSKEFSFDEGSRANAWTYANAMMFGRIKYAAEHAGGQGVPAKIDVMLPAVERAYGLVPGPRDTVIDRRAAYASRRRIPKAPSRYLVETTLRGLLGDAFLALVPTSVDDALLFPETLGDAPMLLLPAAVQRKVVRLLDPIFDYEMDEPIRYESILPIGEDGTGLLEVGDAIVIEPETEGNAEVVEVAEVSVIDGAPAFNASMFEMAHSAGCVATQQPFPSWVSTKRHTYVVLTPEGAADATSRRKVDEFMTRAMRASSTWSIVGGVGGDTGEFSIGVSGIGTQTLGEVTYT
jgi:hypothetical protein